MQKHIWPVNNHYKCLRHQNININEIPWDIFGRRRQKPMTFSGSAHALTRRPRDTNVTDSLFKGTGLLSSPAFFLATLAQAICFSLIRGLKDVDFFPRLPKHDKQPLCSSPLFTACSMPRCKIFTVKLSTKLATRPAFTVWWH